MIRDTSRPVTYNKETIKKFSLGVVVETEVESEMEVGHVVGFSYNSVNEVILKIQLPDDQNDNPHIFLRHPTQVNLL